jgi:hypothetical protein
MPFANERIEGKYQFLEQLDPEDAAKLDDTFMKYLVAAIRASSSSERQQALDKAIEAYENALDGRIYEKLDRHLADEDSSVA